MLYTFKSRDGARSETRSYPIAQVPDSVTADDGTELVRAFEPATAFRLRGSGWASKPERDVANRKRGSQP